MVMLGLFLVIVYPGWCQPKADANLKETQHSGNI
jgi:hypothetical protein